MSDTSHTVFRNDMVLLEARLRVMRNNKLIKYCQKCVGNVYGNKMCSLCKPQSEFPSAFSSQAEWDEQQDQNMIDIPCLASKISLIDVNSKNSGKAKLQSYQLMHNATTFFKLKT